MRVFLVFPMADGQTGPAIKYAFEQLGHPVKAVDARLQTSEIYESYRGFKGDLVFCTKTPEVTDHIKRIKKEFNPVVCTWNPDTRYNINDWRSLFPLIQLSDYHFVPDTKTISAWKRINPNTFWLPQGLQDEIYHRPKSITDTDILKYSCDVNWVGDTGTLHEFRPPLISVIKQMGVNFKTWGCEGHPKIYNEEHNKMVALSKINLGMSGWPENGKSVSVRDYKILGAGGFLLEFYREGIYDLFPENGMDCYHTPEDLMVKIRHWLDHEEERVATAERGYRWVHANATYTHRIKMALEYMKNKL